MTKFSDKSEQRGTLLVEALAMLGLIAMVTPTLYKKSAERLQEIQDINVASQARTMGNVMDAYIRQNFSGLMSSAAEVSNSTVVIEFDDDQSGAYRVGYSSYLPYGYKPDELRGFDKPKVYVHRDDSTLVSYVLYPKIIDIGSKRAARMASLVGANGGIITDVKEAKGTGGAWFLDSTMVEDLEFDESSLTENSLIVTSNEPVSMSYDDSAKYLYRVPPNPADDAGAYFHNTMVTDLYMGGHAATEDGDYAKYANDYYSIFNVKKLTMNTDCNREFIHGDVSSSPEGICDPNVADLYIGKPFRKTLDIADHTPKVEASNGAAWIYGNLAALSENFQLFREEALYDGNARERFGYDADMNRKTDGYDVLQFARMNSTGTGDEEIVVLRAENKKDAERVAMMDDFVQIKRRTDSAAIVDFLVGSKSSGIGDEGALLQAFYDGTENNVYINQGTTSSLTYINPQGGTVYINGGSSATTKMVTHINDMGGNLNAGHEGGWLQAQGFDSSARVHLLANVINSAGVDNRVFTIGHDLSDTGGVGDAYNTNHMMYGDRDKVSLRGGAVRVYSGKGYTGTEAGPVAFQPTDPSVKAEYANLSGKKLDHLTTVASRYTDILGSTYMGNKNMGSTGTDDGKYTREGYTLGVAGSAWIDELLWARQAWIQQAGMKELHAGFKNFTQFSSTPQTAWLNAYDDMVIIRNPTKGGDDNSRGDINARENDVMLQADSTKIVLNDTAGAWAWFENGSATVGAGTTDGTIKNYFFADMDGNGGAGSANVIGSTLANMYTIDSKVSSVVDIQREAMRFGGHWSSSYANRIDAKTGTFTLKTKDVSSTDQDEGAQLYADADKIRTRWVDFQVEDDSSIARFKVAPNEVPESKTAQANVQVNGSFHVTGNEVIHIASNSSNAVGTDDNDHAMFEIDPEYIQVWARDKDGNYAAGGSSAGGYYAMLKINPSDVKGGSSNINDTEDASIYIRKGAIELEESYADGTPSSFGADQGFGYIKANRFVSNTNETAPSYSSKADHGTQYDQYMVNPAYTSVMHDIKLTTRGGARLSDALPDFVLKGIYNVSNDFLEGSKKERIEWSCGERCTQQGYTPINADVAWADPYVGRIPYALCPPGYKNMATLVPTSFNMGQAGEIIQASKVSGMANSSKVTDRWYVNPATRQAKILRAAKELANAQKGMEMNDAIIYPGMEEVSSLIYNGIYQDGTTHDSFLAQTLTRTEGWYLGLKAEYVSSDATQTKSYLISNVGDQNVGTYTYSQDGAKKYAVAQPLYFQQNTWLKTALKPEDKGWEGRIGFIYDTNYYNGLGDGAGSEGMLSNNNQEGYNDNSNTNPSFQGGNFVWNLFPVPTNTLEGHATVYCYFDRSVFKDGDWANKVDQIDQLDDYRDIDNKTTTENKDYIDRLNDPSLKYSDPW